jgi:hypothetical protein
MNIAELTKDIQKVVCSSIDAVLCSHDYKGSMVQEWSIAIVSRATQALKKVMPRSARYTTSCSITTSRDEPLTRIRDSDIRIRWTGRTFQCLFFLSWSRPRSRSLPVLRAAAAE